MIDLRPDSRNQTASGTVGVGDSPPAQLRFVEPILKQTPNAQAA